MLPATTVEKFSLLIDEINESMRSLGTIEGVSSTAVALFLVTTSWLETVTRYGEALRILLAENQAAAVGPLERAIWEMWINWRYLLASDDREKSAAKVLITAQVEALDFLKKQPAARGSTIEGAHRKLEALASRYKDAYDEVQKQRARRPVAWSNMSFSAMEKKVAPDSVLYKVLSWDAHSTIGTLRDVGIKVENGTARITFGRQPDDPVRNPARIAWLAGEVLYSMFKDWRSLWNVPPSE